MTSTLADLQRRNIAQMETASAPEAPPRDTEIRKSVSTEILTDGRKDAGTEAREEVSTEGSAPARKPARKEARAASNTPAPKSASADELMDTVDAALASREPLIGGVKATVDMSPELSTRAKRYLADHRGQNTRQVLIALFDAFLTAKGY